MYLNDGIMGGIWGPVVQRLERESYTFNVGGPSPPWPTNVEVCA